MSYNSQLAGPLYNWTDDLPVCKQSGVGYQTNLTYRAGGGRGEVKDYEDRSFNFQCPDDCYLYGIIDGHGGFKAANFTVQKLPAELLLGQLKDEYTDEEVCLKLQEAFESVQKGFLDDLINDALMEKMNLEEQMPEGMNHEEAFRRFPTLFQHIQELDKEIAGGCSAVISLIHKSRLFVANVGDARALLCRVDEKSSELGIVQLSIDHTISTNSELQRLDGLGLDIEKLQISGIIKTTRSLGDWELKGGYRNIDLLSVAKEEPILSTPSVHGGEEINDSMQFLILMSQGVYTAYAQATGVPPEQINGNIASMVRDEIGRQTTIEGVAQSVVDQICRMHMDCYIKTSNQKCRDDMTLLVRLFNIQLGTHPVTPTEFSEFPQVLRKPTNLTPLIMPMQGQPSHRPPQANEPLPGSPHSSPSSDPSSPQYQPQHLHMLNVRIPSPSSVTVVERKNFHPNGAEYYGNVSFPQKTEPNYMNMPDKTQQDTQPVFCGFTDEEQKKFFRSQPVQANPESLIGISHRRNVPVDSVANSNSSSNSSAHMSAVHSGGSGSAHNSIEDKTKLFNRPAETLELDADGRIEAYVDFTEFMTKINAMGGEKTVFSQFVQGTKLS